jgi:hypothetical protein
MGETKSRWIKPDEYPWVELVEAVRVWKHNRGIGRELHYFFQVHTYASCLSCFPGKRNSQGTGSRGGQANRFTIASQ